MKALLITIFLPLSLLAQETTVEEAIKTILANSQRNPNDSACRMLLDDFYQSFESDEGLGNPKMISASMKLYDYSHRKDMPNRQIALFLEGYMNSISKPEDALKWVRALKDETIAIYGERHPLTYIYEGESYMNARKGDEARAVFSEMNDKYHNSAVAMFYIYKLETDKRLKGTWLSVLQKLYPNHWLVKTIK